MVFLESFKTKTCTFCYGKGFVSTGNARCVCIKCDGSGRVLVGKSSD